MKAAVIKEALLENPHTRMWMRGELEMLYDLAAESIGAIANLGCARGISAGVMAHASSHPVYSVDLYEGSHGSNAEKARELWSRLKVTVQQCIGSTDEWAEILTDVRFGLVFIDADHSYEACKADYENWGRLVMPGGRIAFHDNHMRAVRRVLKEVTLEKVATMERITVYEVAK
jgi:predicted O-methyltransferase YrrM